MDALELSTRAAAHVAAQLALSLDGLPPRNATRSGGRRKRDVPQSSGHDQAGRLCREQSMTKSGMACGKSRTTALLYM